MQEEDQYSNEQDQFEEEMRELKNLLSFRQQNENDKQRYNEQKKDNMGQYFQEKEQNKQQVSQINTKFQNKSSLNNQIYNNWHQVEDFDQKSDEKDIEEIQKQLEISQKTNKKLEQTLLQQNKENIKLVEVINELNSQIGVFQDQIKLIQSQKNREIEQIIIKQNQREWDLCRKLKELSEQKQFLNQQNRELQNENLSMLFRFGDDCKLDDDFIEGLLEKIQFLSKQILNNDLRGKVQELEQKLDEFEDKIHQIELENIEKRTIQCKSNQKKGTKAFSNFNSVNKQKNLKQEIPKSQEKVLLLKQIDNIQKKVTRGKKINFQEISEDEEEQNEYESSLKKKNDQTSDSEFEIDNQQNENQEDQNCENQFNNQQQDSNSFKNNFKNQNQNNSNEENMNGDIQNYNISDNKKNNKRKPKIKVTRKTKFNSSFIQQRDIVFNTIDNILQDF